MKSVLAGMSLVLLGASPTAASDRDNLVSGAVFSAVTLASDYRYEGVSELSERPAIQGYVHWYRPDGFFAGVYGTKVNFGYAGSPTYEIDSYAGKNFSFDKGRSELKLEGLYSAFPDNRTPGPTFNFFEGVVQLKYVQGAWTAIGVVSYVPQSSYGSGRLLRFEGEADYGLSKTMTLKAVVGHQGEGIAHERTYWSLGAAKTWRNVTLELRYVGTDRTRENCGFQPKACNSALVGSLTVALPPLLLRAHSLRAR